MIELMMVVAIIGILGSMALSLYSDYTVRARVAEALAFAAEAKTIVSENAMHGQGDLAVGFAGGRTTKIIQSLTIDPILGDITVRFTDIVQAGATLVFTPTSLGLPLQVGTVPSEAIDWRCDRIRSTLLVQYRPPDCK